ncbi:MAG: carboxylating nicotinate-nucleotide diphosphorylase [Rhodospirillum sp.]|nr:carboxylating nicotinate-nucleotide diphosphorylase [Rhodospirillum sp.]MCF8488225.1 carboxylating nicotinate-nucleotide diphosphorylase [Rhodospirillum sp.]MCF8502522.1 carboxylating nicotinate-nucleotide diphosphorylase [Rhodospirillum sp.]
MTSSSPLLPLAPFPALLLEPIVRAALAEDLGRRGDITTEAVIPADAQATAVMRARKPGVAAGVEAAVLAFRLMDPSVTYVVHKGEGAVLAPGDDVMTLSGPARAILSAERVALNFAGHLSGIATATAELVAAVRPHPVRITCTRKTTPGLRGLEKYAVRAGGGSSHRYGLDDAVLIKDNHIAVAGSVTEAIARARAFVGHLVKVEVEVDTLAQLAEALAAGPDVVLLDNMAPDLLREAVALTRTTAKAPVILEASGGVTRETAPAIAATGVDVISVGWLTHSAPSLDLGLDIDVR